MRPVSYELFIKIVFHLLKHAFNSAETYPRYMNFVSHTKVTQYGRKTARLAKKFKKNEQTFYNFNIINHKF